MGGCKHSKPAEAVHDLRGNLARTRTGVNFESLYDTVKVLGEGSMGSVRLVKSKSTQERYAAKMIQLQRVADETMVAEMKNEIEMLRALDNPNIVKLDETFITRRQITIVMECCSGGDLYARHPYAETAAAHVIRQVTSAINYMHDRGFVHRDLKFENIMFLTEAPHAPVKLIDFGLSKKYRTTGRRMSDVVGTLYSMAPEVARGAYTQACDLWSIGVVTFMMISDRMPFDTSSEYALLRAIARADYAYAGRVWTKVSDDARSFIDTLLVVNPEQRATATQAIGHRWIRTHREEISGQEVLRDSGIMQQIQKFGTYSKLKRTALMVIAHQAQASELRELRAAFMKFDIEMNGTICLDEFYRALTDSGVNTDEGRELFETLDMDQSGRIHYMEFLAATLEAKMDLQEEHFADAFDRLDADDSSYITRENLRDILGTQYDEEEASKMIDAADEKGDGKIDFEEFKAFMRAGLKEELQGIDDDAKAFAGGEGGTGAEMPVEAKA